jgi:hypothetical protein
MEFLWLLEFDGSLLVSETQKLRLRGTGPRLSVTSDSMRQRPNGAACLPCAPAGLGSWKKRVYTFDPTRVVSSHLRKRRHLGNS